MKLYFIDGLVFLGKWANFEIHGVIDDPKVGCYQVDGDEQPDFYSVYVRYQNEDFRGLECIADCDTKEEAEQLVSFLNQLIDNKIPYE